MTVTTASAHVILDRKMSSPGSYKAIFGVPHGCSGSATTELTIVIPEGFIGVKPAPKPGWTLSVERGPYARSYDYFHGSKLAEGAKRVTWTGGPLADEHYDEFILIGFFSDAFKPKSKVYFAVEQRCGDVTVNWDQIPAKGQDAHDLKTPAPAVRIEAK
ncbi:MAG: YcnI family protein [Hyphomicrobium sp.]|nr:YcnI family protein [Hyphomicrobium sp.]